eukprot:361512-Chlamydomonas_euryale.AAC.1
MLISGFCTSPVIHPSCLVGRQPVVMCFGVPRGGTSLLAMPHLVVVCALVGLDKALPNEASTST